MKNLFDASAKPAPAAGAAPEPEADGGVDTMQQMFTDFNIDRKVGQGMEALRKAFDLPGDAVRLRKSRCALVSQLGAFYVTSYHLCFIGGLGKKLAVPFSRKGLSSRLGLLDLRRSSMVFSLWCLSFRHWGP